MRYIVFDVFNLFLTRGYDQKLLELENILPDDQFEKYIYYLGFPDSLPTFLFSFDLVDTLFRLKDKYTTCFYTRYKPFTTNCVLSKLGVKGLFDEILTPQIYNSDAFDDVIFFSSYGKMGLESHNLTDRSQLSFDNISAKLK